MTTNHEIAVASVVTAAWVLALWGWCRSGAVCPAESPADDNALPAGGIAEWVIRLAISMPANGYARTLAAVALALAVAAALA